MLEIAYQRAVAIELEARGISYESERRVPVFFKGQVVCHHRIDLVVDDRLVLELKAVERLAPVHSAQAIGYLRAAKLRLALLVNFNVPSLAGAIRRIVL
jgi:GxxExxY protein